ncbi:MAG: Imm40 family immunity protein [bacterium]|jgi:hypothetical protein
MCETSEYSRFVVSRGCSLESLGLSEIALPYADAQQAVKLAIGCHLSILGGDVYYRTGKAMEPAYANWHVDRKDGESDDMYSRRSGEESERYLSALPKPVGKEYLIVIVTA